jgi:hypothetical protein
MVHPVCWTHARPGFANVVKLNPGDPVASPIVAMINQLFAVDCEERENGLSLEARHRSPQQKDPELLEKIKAAIEAARAGPLPGGVLANARQYTLGNWLRRTWRRRLKISTRDYLVAVLPGLADRPVQRRPALTPRAWAAQRQSSAESAFVNPALAPRHTIYTCAYSPFDT